MRKLKSLLLFLLFISTSAMAQEITITGKVTGATDGTPLQGVTVAATNANNKLQTMSNGEGSFSIKIPSGVKELVFTYSGMAPITEKINGCTVWSLLLNTALITYNSPNLS